MSGITMLDCYMAFHLGGMLVTILGLATGKALMPAIRMAATDMVVHVVFWPVTTLLGLYRAMNRRNE